MKIDHDLYVALHPDAHLYAEIPYVFGYQHFSVGFSQTMPLNLIERIGHVALGILLWVPLLNIPIAWADRSICHVPAIRIFHANGSTAFERGFQHGTQFKSDIDLLYYHYILPMIRFHENNQMVDCLKKAKTLEMKIPAEIRDEMRGLAEGAHVPYDHVLMVHTFLDIFPGLYGCSAIGVTHQNKEIATNHFSSIDPILCPRYFFLEQVARRDDLKEKQMQELLQKVTMPDTVQSILFRCSDQSISLAAGHRLQEKIDLPKTQLFERSRIDSVHPAYLGRTLDWPLPTIGNHTIVLIEKMDDGTEVANITFPGFIGMLSGMNEHGVALSVCQSGHSSQVGCPNTLLLRQTLAKSRSVDDAVSFLKMASPASSMNVIMADSEKAALIELDPSRADLGPAFIKTAVPPMAVDSPRPGFIGRAFGFLCNAASYIWPWG